MPTGQPDLHKSSRRLSSQTILHCVKLTIKMNQHDVCVFSICHHTSITYRIISQGKILPELNIRISMSFNLFALHKFGTGLFLCLNLNNFRRACSDKKNFTKLFRYLFES